MKKIFSALLFGCFCLLTPEAYAKSSHHHSRSKSALRSDREHVTCNYRGCNFSYRCTAQACPLCGWPNAYYGYFKLGEKERKRSIISCRRCHNNYCNYQDFCPFCIFLRDHR